MKFSSLNLRSVEPWCSCSLGIEAAATLSEGSYPGLGLPPLARGSHPWSGTPTLAWGSQPGQGLPPLLGQELPPLVLGSHRWLGAPFKALILASPWHGGQPNPGDQLRGGGVSFFYDFPRALCPLAK